MNEHTKSPRRLIEEVDGLDSDTTGGAEKSESLLGMLHTLAGQGSEDGSRNQWAVGAGPNPPAESQAG